MSKKLTSTRRQLALKKPVGSNRASNDSSSELSLLPAGTLNDSSSEDSYSSSSPPPETEKNSSSDDLTEYLSLSYGFPSVDKIVRSCFEKKFSFNLYFSSMRKVKESLYTSKKWSDNQLREFQVLKKKLNSVKNELDHFQLNEWHRHTSATNPAALVMRKMKDEVKVEFLTQAWCKFYEIVSSFRLIPKDAIKNQKLYSVHLCEAPGAFVASLNHYLRLNHPQMRWFWKASTLNPYYEGNTLSQMINDDRFMLQTIDHWDFGSDFSGDITHTDYTEHLRRECGDQLAHLVTADGSFDCQGQPNEQENSVSWLLMKETLTALRILRRGGHFVLKMFTCFECDTICLLYLLNKVFESVSIMKPATSKEGNSEVYVICREYGGEEVAGIYLKELLQITEERHSEFAMFSFAEVNRQFMKNLIDCVSLFAERQISVIERNIRLFPRRNDPKLRRVFEFVQEELWAEFVSKYEVKSISSTAPLFDINFKRFDVFEKRCSKYGGASHADRVLRTTLDIFHSVSEEIYKLDHRCMVRTTRMPVIDVDGDSCFNIKCGKPIMTVRSSQYCMGTFMRLRNELMETTTPSEFNYYSSDQSVSPSPTAVNAEICDVRETYANAKTHHEAEYKAFRMVNDILYGLKVSEDFLLIGYPLLTQFSVNFLCILNTMFRTVNYENSDTLRFSGFKPDKHEEWALRMERVKKTFTSDCAVLSFLPLTFVVKSKAPLYAWLVAVNNARVRSDIRRFMFRCR